MESTAPDIARETQLRQWVILNAPARPLTWTRLPGDASFRRYHRIATESGDTFMVMDAPPPGENIRPFVAIAHALRALGLKTPEILAEDLAQGFLILTDFGDATYLNYLTPENGDQLYTSALLALIKLQTCSGVPGHPLPVFDAAWIAQEWRWHQEWFLDKWLGVAPDTAHLATLNKTIELLSAEIQAQPKVFMHRDFHSANLMYLEKQNKAHHQPSDQCVGILDFQDAFKGPITYDLASLLRDCYVDWPKEKIQAWVAYYWRHSQENKLGEPVDLKTFTRWFDFMGIERHLKALFTFARKAVRDQQPRYLAYIPRTYRYIYEVSRQHVELAPLHTYCVETLEDALRQKMYKG